MTIAWQHTEIGPEEAEIMIRARITRILQKLPQLTKAHLERLCNPYAIKIPREWESNGQSSRANCKELKSLEEAFVRIKEGTWGICEECGEEIPKARLEICPGTTFCVPCLREQEQAVGKRYGRATVLEIPQKHAPATSG
jgi:formylmethanofuran dehydrogenase subunit E